MKMPNALVVDDHENILTDIGTRLKSLGHTYVTAKSQEEAEAILDSTSHYFDYILLDVQIPCSFQSPPKQQYGKNLLAKIRQKPGYEKTPIIVITAYGNDSPHLAVEMWKLGANDFINKPFDEEKITLEEKIEEVLRKSKLGGTAAKHNLKPFSGGKLVFYPDRVELCVGTTEIPVCGDRSDATIRSILELLRKKRESKDRKTYTGKHIGDALKLPRGDAHVREAVRDFRELCAKRLCEQGFECTPQDIIQNSQRGYQFPDSIEISAGSDDPPEISTELSARQKSILRVLNHHGKLSRKKLGDKLGLPVEAFKDDLQSLADKSVVLREGNGSSAFYFLPAAVEKGVEKSHAA